MSDETTTAIAVTKPGRSVAKTHNIMDMILDEMGPLAFCEHLAASGLYAKGNNALAKIVAIIATGAEVGMPPMWSLKNIQFVGDKHSFTAGGVGDLVMRSGYMMYHITEKTPVRCELRWTRNGEDVGSSYFDVEKARAAGLWGSNTWKKYPESMLFARALTDGGRTYCPEVFGGSPYTPDELKSEVVQVTQSGRMPGVDHPDITKRPDGQAQADYGKARATARNNLVTVVKDCTTSRDEQIRVWNACLKKADKNDKMMTAEDYSEAAGRVKAFHEDGNLSEWCDTIHGPDPDVVGDAEVVEPVVDDPVEKAWKSANGLFHAVLGKFLTANKHDAKGKEYTIIKDAVRSNCELPAGAEWSLVTPEAMRQTVKVLEYDGGKMAKTGLAGEWAANAIERGAI